LHRVHLAWVWFELTTVAYWMNRYLPI
jgi:hypothetical protein